MKLKEYLIKEKLAPDEFAEKVKLSANTIRACKRGVRVSFKSARKIEKATGGLVTIEELIGEA